MPPEKLAQAKEKKKVLGYVFKDQVRFSSWYGVLPAWLDPLN